MIRSFPACRMVGCGVIAVLAVTALPSRALNGPWVSTGTDPQFDTRSDILLPVGAVEPDAILEGNFSTMGQNPRSEWRKDGKRITLKGATQVLNASALDPVTLNTAGDYVLHAGSVAGVGHSSPVHVAVVDTMHPQAFSSLPGKSIKIAAPVAGNGLSFSWTKDGNAIVDSTNVSGTSTRILEFKAATVADGGEYLCSVSSPAGSLTTASLTLVIAEAVPTVTTAMLPEGAVLKSYSTQVAAFGATTYAASGLPVGLKIDPKTGEISGSPRAPGVFTVRLITSNAKGKSRAVALKLRILPLPEFVLGTSAMIGGQNFPGGGLVRVDCVVGASGAFTGRVQTTNLDGRIWVYRVKGSLRFEYGSPVFDYYIGDLPIMPTLLDPQSGGLALVFDEYEGPRLVKTNVGVPPVTLASGGTLSWDAKTRPFPAPAYSTAHLTNTSGRIEGTGYGTCTVSASGRFALAIKLPDGTGIAIPTFVPRAARGVLSAWLYGKRGALMGNCTVGEDGLIIGDLTWTRPPAHFHEGSAVPVPLGEGFMNEPLHLSGARYDRPGTLQRPAPLVLDVPKESGQPSTPNPVNTRTTLFGGGLTQPATSSGWLRTNHTLIYDPILPGSAPEVEFRPVTFNAARGTFTGTAIRRSVDPQTNQTIVTTIRHQGVVVANQVAEGYFVRTVRVFRDGFWFQGIAPVCGGVSIR